jgi:hypothetical protein
MIKCYKELGTCRMCSKKIVINRTGKGFYGTKFYCDACYEKYFNKTPESSGKTTDK